MVCKAPNVFEGKFAYHQVAIEDWNLLSGCWHLTVELIPKDDRSANLLQVLDAALMP